MKHTSNRRKPGIALLIFFIGTIIFTGCDKLPLDPLPHNNHGNSTNADEQSAKVAHDWYRLQLSILLERNSALNGVHFAYIGVGLYESVHHGIDNSRSFSKLITGMPAMPDIEKNKSYNWAISANAALADLVRTFYQGLTTANLKSIDSLEYVWSEYFKTVSTSSVLERSTEFGKKTAASIFAWYQKDDFNPSNIGYVPPKFDGAWEPTPPAFANPVSPYIGSATTFLTEHASLVSPPPIRYSVEDGSDFVNMVREVYDVKANLNDEQKNIALYWVDQGNGIGFTPPGHDMALVLQALEQYSAKLGTAAEAYAKAGIAERDASIVTFRSKYKYNLIRPVTYIQKFEKDWMPFINTPPHPEYPAAHAAITGAVTRAVAHVIGEDKKVVDRIYAFRGFTDRTFNGLFEAGKEAGISRLYGGIHYRPSINEGLTLARTIGDNVGNLQLKR